MLLYHMIYPKDRWITAEELIGGANDAIANYKLDSDAPANADDAIDILHDVGIVTVSDSKFSEDDYGR